MDLSKQNSPGRSRLGARTRIGTGLGNSGTQSYLGGNREKRGALSLKRKKTHRKSVQRGLQRQEALLPHVKLSAIICSLPEASQKTWRDQQCMQSARLEPSRWRLASPAQTPSGNSTTDTVAGFSVILKKVSSQNKRKSFHTRSGQVL